MVHYPKHYPISGAVFGVTPDFDDCGMSSGQPREPGAHSAIQISRANFPNCRETLVIDRIA